MDCNFTTGRGTFVIGRAGLFQLSALKSWMYSMGRAGYGQCEELYTNVKSRINSSALPIWNEPALPI